MSVELPTREERLRKIIDIVSQLISVDRLKEIQILTSFQRLGGKLIPPDIVGQSKWLPAIELYGEGIFFTLKEKIIATWEKLPLTVKSRKVPPQIRKYLIAH